MQLPNAAGRSTRTKCPDLIFECRSLVKRHPKVRDCMISMRHNQRHQRYHGRLSTKCRQSVKTKHARGVLHKDDILLSRFAIVFCSFRLLDLGRHLDRLLWRETCKLSLRGAPRWINVLLVKDSACWKIEPIATASRPVVWPSTFDSSASGGSARFAP